MVYLHNKAPFIINKRGKASYITHITDLPDEYTEAPPHIARAYHTIQQAMWQLVIDNVGLTATVAQRLGIDDNTAHDVGLNALWSAAANWKPNGGAGFSTYAYICIRHAYVSHLRQRSKETLVAEIPDQPVLDQQYCDQLQYITRRLDSTDRMLLVLRFWKDLTYEEIGIKLGISKSSARRILTDILERCRDGCC